MFLNTKLCVTSWPQGCWSQSNVCLTIIYALLHFMWSYESGEMKKPIRITIIRPQSFGVAHREMKIRIVLTLPIPRGPKASLVQCLPSCFFLSHSAISAPVLPSSASLSVSVSFFFFPFILSLATRKLFYGFGLEDLSGAISPLVNKCCDRRQVEEKLELDERRETPSSGSHVPRLIFCVTVAAFVCTYLCVYASLVVQHTDSGTLEILYYFFFLLE